MADGSDMGSDRIKHLELIQPVVARLANNSFLIKGWALTIAAGFLAVLATRASWTLATVGLIPLLGFWGLDALFLRQERRYRRLYELVRADADAVPPLSMDVSQLPDDDSWASTAISGTLIAFYGTLAAVDLTVLIISLLR